MHGIFTRAFPLLLAASLFAMGCGTPSETDAHYSPPVDVYDADAFTITLPEQWTGNFVRVWTFAPPRIEDAALRGRAHVRVDFEALDAESSAEVTDPDEFHDYLLSQMVRYQTSVEEIDQRASGSPHGLPESEMRVVMAGENRREVFFFRHILVTGGYWAVAGICDADAWPGLARELREIVRSFVPRDPTRPPYAYMQEN